MSKERYIEAKQKWAAKQLARGFQPRAVATTDRLPPGQKLTTGCPVLDLGVQPAIAHPDWRLQIDGLVERPAALTWTDFHALPQVEDVSDFHCVTSWSKYDCRWGGVAFTALYELVQPKPEARFVYFTSYDGYSTNVPLPQCLDDDVLVAARFEGQPLAREAMAWHEHVTYRVGDHASTWKVKTTREQWDRYFASEGTYRLERTADGRTRRVVVGDLSIRVRLVGPVAERLALAEVKKTYDAEAVVLGELALR